MTSSPRIAVYSPNGSISKHDHSHRAAWPKMVLDSRGIKDFVLQPTDSLANYEETWLYLGMEFTGALNLFGGASDENAGRLLKILEAKNLRYLALSNADELCPLLGSIASARTKGKVGDRWKNAKWGLLDEACMAAKPVHQGSHKNGVVGDSHALSLYDGQSVVYRYDHKTLHGALEIGLNKLFDSSFERTMLCFGNIDCQHHFARFDRADVSELASKYVSQAAELQDDMSIEIMELLPILEETRKIATPGYYKNKPWHGSWEVRDGLRKLFNQVLTEEAMAHKNIKIVKWPEYIFNSNGSFNQAYMERPRGVHLSWEHRRQTWPA